MKSIQNLISLQPPVLLRNQSCTKLERVAAFIAQLISTLWHLKNTKFPNDAVSPVLAAQGIVQGIQTITCSRRGATVLTIIMRIV